MIFTPLFTNITDVNNVATPSETLMRSRFHGVFSYLDHRLCVKSKF